MAKFLNKKEQVYDIKLTSYGKYLLSTGEFKPEYYAFFDDNIIYDYDCARASGSAGLSGSREPQNEIIDRIRETQYIETLTLFEDVEKPSTNLITENVGPDGAAVKYFEIDITPQMITPRRDNYVFSAMIGDAYLEGDTQNAPAWKMVTLNGNILSSSMTDVKNDVAVPQLNIQLNYALEIVDYDATLQLSQDDLRQVLGTTQQFADNRVIRFKSEDLLVYGEEVNTALLTENFDIEVFEIDFDAVPATYEGGTAKDSLKRKYFPSNSTEIKGGLMIVDDENKAVVAASILSPIENAELQYLKESKVSYYFDVELDENIDRYDACKAASFYNKDSYYVDIDHDCTDITIEETTYIDIYGKVTEPEICL